MIILLFFAFLSGLLTIAAPCIWPLLPVVLSSSALRGHRRPVGLTLGILISFGIITLSISYLVHLLGFDASLLRTIAVIVLAVMGATLLFPALTKIIEGLVSRIVGGAGWTKSGAGFWPGFISGLPLGVVWAPCAGPILATIATLAATRTVGVSIILVTIAYLIGIGIPLFIFSYAGQHFVQTTRFLSRYTGTMQKVFGVAIVGTAGLIFFNWDTRLQAELLTAVPSYSNFINRLERNSAVTTELNKIKGIESAGVSVDKDRMFNASDPAPEFKGITRWLNLPPDQNSLSLEQLRGKVVLIDFWTYTCINCIRALPHATAWYNEYKDDGLVVIGVHTPEFAFERDTSNVEQAIQRFGIRYPVAQDNEYATWKAYRNQYWPAKYLIDKDGNLRRVEYGEGEYDKTEQAIRELLREAGAKLPGGLTGTPDNTPKVLSSPESYLGADRMINYYPNASIDEGDHTDLQTDPKLSLNSFDFGGDWNVQAEYSQTVFNAVLEYNFHGEHVYLVMHKPSEGIGTIRVLVDGSPVDGVNAGADVQNGLVTVDSDRLYELVDLKGDPGRHILRLEFSPGIQLFAFTFG
ncbi:MAG TPA: cytochrome c biogenesis protein DipZ [Dehalococcoidia bacterium]|nr:cytochrome c biogenesis protein DipZ [Dehalococcoidia bacterium]